MPWIFSESGYWVAGAALDVLNETETDRKERPIDPIKIVKTQVFVISYMFPLLRLVRFVVGQPV